jgi:hypothetical protein
MENLKNTPENKAKSQALKAYQITDQHRKTRMYKHIRMQLSWIRGELLNEREADYYFRYLLRFPENTWFSCTNSVDNPFPDELSVFQKMANNSLIEEVYIPIPDPHNMSGLDYGIRGASRFLYKLDLDYDYTKYGIEVK